MIARGECYFLFLYVNGSTTLSVFGRFYALVKVKNSNLMKVKINKLNSNFLYIKMTNIIEN